MSHNPSQAYEADIYPDLPASLRTVRDFYNGSGSAIAANMLVMIDEADTDMTLGAGIEISASAADGDTAHRVVGVTERAIPDGKWGKVCVWGLCYIEADGALAANNPITTDAGIDGHVVIGTLGTHHILGVALEADGATVTGQSKCFLNGCGG